MLKWFLPLVFAGGVVAFGANVAGLRVDAVPTCGVAMLGDSIFSQLRERGALSPPFDNVCNLGRSGATAVQIATISVPTSARVVILEGGLNDVLDAKSDASIYVAYRTGLKALSGRTVLLVGIVPADQRTMREDYAAYATAPRIAQINAALLRICAEHSHCVPAARTMQFNPVGNTVDGIHLNSSGNDDIVRLMAGDFYNLARERAAAR